MDFDFQGTLDEARFGTALKLRITPDLSANHCTLALRIFALAVASTH